MNESEIRDFFYEALPTYGLKHGKKELSVAGLRIDIFAIDVKHMPYIIEFKKAKNRHMVGQAAQYLSLVPTYKDEIEKSINFYDIRWDKLRILCIAPEFADRDFEAAEFKPLKGRVHFYKFRAVQNTRNKVFSLNLEYAGPSNKGPLMLPKKLVDEFDLWSVAEEFYQIKKKEARREYFAVKILPLLESIARDLKDFEAKGFYPHIAYYDQFFTLGLRPDNKKSHRASIRLMFSEGLSYGFDLTHAPEDGQKLSTQLKEPKNLKKFIENTLALEDYSIYIPNTGVESFIPIQCLNEKGLSLLLSAYNPVKFRDSYFRIITDYALDTLTVPDAVKLIRDEYSKFKYIFDLILE